MKLSDFYSFLKEISVLTDMNHPLTKAYSEIFALSEVDLEKDFLKRDFEILEKCYQEFWNTLKVNLGYISDEQTVYYEQLKDFALSFLLEEEYFRDKFPRGVMGEPLPTGSHGLLPDLQGYKSPYSPYRSNLLEGETFQLNELVYWPISIVEASGDLSLKFREIEYIVSLQDIFCTFSQKDLLIHPLTHSDFLTVKEFSAIYRRFNVDDQQSICKRLSGLKTLCEILTEDSVTQLLEIIRSYFSEFRESFILFVQKFVRFLDETFGEDFIEILSLDYGLSKNSEMASHFMVLRKLATEFDSKDICFHTLFRELEQYMIQIKRAKEYLNAIYSYHLVSYAVLKFSGLFSNGFDEASEAAHSSSTGENDTTSFTS